MGFGVGLVRLWGCKGGLGVQELMGGGRPSLSYRTQAAPGGCLKSSTDDSGTFLSEEGAPAQSGRESLRQGPGSGVLSGGCRCFPLPSTRRVPARRPLPSPQKVFLSYPPSSPRGHISKSSCPHSSFCRISFCSTSHCPHNHTLSKFKITPLFEYKVRHAHCRKMVNTEK